MAAGPVAVRAVPAAAPGADVMNISSAFRFHTLRRGFTGILLGCASAISMATAQGTDGDNVIVRSTQVTGIPPLSFDLEDRSTQRYALVVGNGAYDSVTDLPNAVNDARDMANLLRRGGYEVADYYNVTKLEFEAALRRLLFEVEPGTELFIYYAGHGVQIGGQNYLLPSDTEVSSIYDVPFATVSLSSIMSLGSARARSVVAVLDACRDNPFPDQEGVVYLDGVPSKLRTGFTAQDSPINSLVVFSTSPGAVALDGIGDNSPFTTALLNVAQEDPELPFNEMLKEVRRDVYALTGRRQVPWESSSLIEPVYISRNSDLFVSSSQEQVTSQLPVSDMAITAMLDRAIRVDDKMTGADSSDEMNVVMVSQPTAGRLAVAGQGQSANLPTSGGISMPAGQSLVYRPRAQQTRALKLAAAQSSDPDAVMQDTFSVAMNGKVSNVQMTLSIDDCDFQAGDHLDPDGVGIARFPNELEPQSALAACAASVEREPDNGRFHYQLGRAQLALRDVAAAKASFERAASLGHTRAFQAQGTAVVTEVAQTAGVRAGRAPDAALELYKQGVERGDPYAYHSLGRQYLLYPQSQDEQRQGFDLLSRSLELGHTFSMNALGLYFLNEDETHYDARRGLRYLRESAARGDIYGYQNMGFVYANGVGGTQKDLARAYDLFVKASEGGHPRAPASIGRMYNAGTAPGGQNLKRAVEWYDVGLSRGDGWGGANAAWLIANRNPDGYTKFDAAVFAAKAASLRNPEPKAEALNTLRNLDGRSLNGGIQQLMQDLGVDITVDGAFGPQSEAALNALAADLGVRFPTDRIDRLVALAQIYWERSTFRVDLY